MNLNGKNVVLGITGGIAVYKVCTLVRLLKQSGANVDIIMTAHAEEFVSKLTFETLCGNPVVCDMFNRERKWEVEHISLAKKADVFVVAPATANIIGKYANGIADDMLSTTLMATKSPVLFAPAMNTNMYEEAAFQSNLKKIVKMGATVIDAEVGELACGDSGKGRMAEAEQIYGKIEEMLFPKQDFVNRTVLVTAGATEEKIDPVRVISNYSSGKMGCAIANAAFNRGAKVILILGKHTANVPKGVEVVDVTTTEEMAEAVSKHFKESDVFIMAAAPCDYKVVNYSTQKVKNEKLTLELVKTVDIAKSVGEKKENKKLVIFSAETQNCVNNAKEKLNSKHADLVVANDVTQKGAGFACDTNVVTLITQDDQKAYGLLQKSEVAEIILDKVSKLK